MWFFFKGKKQNKNITLTSWEVFKTISDQFNFKILSIQREEPESRFRSNFEYLYYAQLFLFITVDLQKKKKKKKKKKRHKNNIGRSSEVRDKAQQQQLPCNLYKLGLYVKKYLHSPSK